MLEALQSSAETVPFSAEPKPYVTIFSPLEHSQQEVGRPELPPIEFDNLDSPISTAGEPAVAPAKRKRRAWAPSADDHLIYRWVQLEGKGQGWAAQCFGISQSTVSRIVQRYERWQAHAEARDDGRLDPAERLRAQRWLAFERNEQMLASCLRLAADMEGFQDISRTVKSNPVSSPSAESTLRTEWSVMDRTGMAARFLRLAFRINLEQLKLAEATPAPLPEPLSEEEVSEQEAHAIEDRAEIVAVRERTKQDEQATHQSLMDQLAAAQHELAEARREAIQARAEAEAARMGATAGLPSSAELRVGDPLGATSAAATKCMPEELESSSYHFTTANSSRPITAGQASSGTPIEPPGDESDMHNLHNLHTGIEPQTCASADAASSCDGQAAAEKMFATCLHTTLAVRIDEPREPPTPSQTMGEEPREPSLGLP